MRPGAGQLIAGVLLLGGGIAVTVTSEAVVWYGAVMAGVVGIARGVHGLLTTPGPTEGDR